MGTQVKFGDWVWSFGFLKSRIMLGFVGICVFTALLLPFRFDADLKVSTFGALCVCVHAAGGFVRMRASRSILGFVIAFKLKI